MTTITSITAREILDSRAKPTLEVLIRCGDAIGTFGVPSGASTGSTEAKELRDADGHMRTALKNIEEVIAPALLGKDAAHQQEIDDALLALDGTHDKSRLGGNAMIGVSIAAAKAAAAAKDMPVFAHLRTLASMSASRPVPYLYMNYINGGKHVPAGTETVSFQEHLIVPDTTNITEALAIARAVGDTLETIIRDVYGDTASASMGDEGGYIIPEVRYEQPFMLLMRAIAESGNEGKVRLATDVAASSFYHAGTYTVDGRCVDARTLESMHAHIAATYPILSIEDPFEEGAQDDFVALQRGMSARVMGDDLTTTNAERIARAADAGAIKAVIIKPNQVGTLSETLDAMQAARMRGVDCVVSHRSGETMDDFVADLAFAFGAFGLKAGSLRRPERTAKYERLAAIAHL